MFTRLLEWIRKVIDKMFGTQTVQKALDVELAISASMVDALQKWTALYLNQADWLVGDMKSLNLAASISGEIARAVTIEMKAKITGSPRADFLNEQVKAILPKLRDMVEYGAAKGGLVFKPYVVNKKIEIDFVQADMFYPVAFDANKNMTAAVFADQRQRGQYFYTRLEYQGLEGTKYIIRNEAFRSSSASELGSSVPLTSLPEWAELQPAATISDIKQPLFAYFRYPSTNSIDPTSPLGVSCFARAIDLIKQADQQWTDLLWEFESGQRALYADVTAFVDENGKKVLPTKRLYRALNGGSNLGDNPEGLFHDWSPTLRQAEILAGLDAILRRIEFTCGLAYGTLSNPQTVDKTATELKISNQRSYATITDTQKALKSALDALLYAMDTWATIYKLAPKGAYTAAWEFDDSIVVDKESQMVNDRQTVTMGAMPKYIYLMRNYGLDEPTARKWITENQAEQPQEQDLFKGS